MAQIVTSRRADPKNPQRGSKLDFKPLAAEGPLKEIPAPKPTDATEEGEPTDATEEDFGEGQPERKGRKAGK